MNVCLHHITVDMKMTCTISSVLQLTCHSCDSTWNILTHSEHGVVTKEKLAIHKLCRKMHECGETDKGCLCLYRNLVRCSEVQVTNLRCPMTIIRNLSPRSCISWIWTKVPIWYISFRSSTTSDSLLLSKKIGVDIQKLEIAGQIQKENNHWSQKL